MLALLDNSYFDCSFEARLHRQKWQIIYLWRKAKKWLRNKKVDLDLKITAFKHSRRKRHDANVNWNGGSIIIKCAMDLQVQEKGGIVDNMGNVHTTAHSYKQYLKDNNLVIRDWTPGSNAASRQFQGADKKQIEKDLARIEKDLARIQY